LFGKRTPALGPSNQNAEVQAQGRVRKRTSNRSASTTRPHTPRYVGAIDQGTTSTRFIAFGEDGRSAGSAQQEHTQLFPQPGWAENDAETTVVWNQQTGEPLHRALSAWQRTARK
jgi:glycerol kinase